jgi:hypothetical protein
MTEKRNRRIQIHVLNALVSEVRARPQGAGVKAWREHEFEDGSLDFRFTKLTDSEVGLIMTTVPLEACAKRAIGAGSIAHLSPDELKQLISKKPSDAKA